MIVRKTMRSDPDVHPLTTIELKVVQLRTTDLTGLCCPSFHFTAIVYQQECFLGLYTRVDPKVRGQML